YEQCKNEKHEKVASTVRRLGSGRARTSGQNSRTLKAKSGLWLAPLHIPTSRDARQMIDFTSAPEWAQKRLISRLSLRLDAGEPNHLGPFFDFARDEPSEVGGRAGQQGALEVGQSRLHLRISETRIELPVERLEDVGGGALGRADAEPFTRFVTRNGFNDRGN